MIATLRRLTVLALIVLGATLAVRAQSAAFEPLITPDEMLAVDQIKVGMKGYGLSVFQGTKIERFDVTVLGVLKKIDFGGDMVLIRVENGTPVNSGSGVSAGMSGSPIYIDGKIVGALAFTWPFSKQPLAGVTPISQMLENYRPGSAPVSVATAGELKPEGGPLLLDGKQFATAKVVPDAGLASRSSSTLYLTPVATPVMCSGMALTGRNELQQRLAKYGAVVAPGPGQTDLPPADRPKLEPGAAIGVQLLGGDVDATAIGTVTYVKGNHVLAFGHPMFGLGSISMPMTTAFIHGVISSQDVSFKMGSPVETVGSISQDRNWSIGGAMGDFPKTVEAEFVITDQDRGVHRDYHVRAAVQRDLTPQLLYGSLMNAIGSVSPPSVGSTRGTFEVWPEGLAPIQRENAFAVGERPTQIEQLFGDPMAGKPLAELLTVLDTLQNNAFGPVSVSKIKATIEVTEKRRAASIERVYADRKTVRPGDKVEVGVVIQPVDGPREIRKIEVAIPSNLPAGKLQIGVAGGGSAEHMRQSMSLTRATAKSLPQLLSQFSQRERNDDLVVEVSEPVVGVAASGREVQNLPNVVVEVLTQANPSGIRMVRSHEHQTQGTPWVLSGSQVLDLQIDADEKDKAGPPPTATGADAAQFSILDLLKGAFQDDDDDSSDLSEDQQLATLRAHRPALKRVLARIAAQKSPGTPQVPSLAELEKLVQAEERAAGPGPIGATPAGPATPVKKGQARTPGVWRLKTAADFRNGKLEGLLAGGKGELTLAPETANRRTAPDRVFWAEAASASGRAYVGGWLDGSIQRVDPGSTPEPFFTAPGATAVTALTVDDEGTLFASTEPEGTIYRITPDGKGAPLVTLVGRQVWALKKIGADLYAGTGPRGEVMRITPDGKASTAFTSPDRHVFALAASPDGALYCGTYPRGKIFRLKGDKAVPVYEVPDAAVTSLACDGTGNLFIGTSPKATVLRLTPNGEVSTLFTSTEKHVLSMVTVNGDVIAAVGNPGKVYRIRADGVSSVLWDPLSAYVLSLARDAAGSVYATTAGPTQVVQLGPEVATKGAYTSQVLDAGTVARWGAMRWNGVGEGIQVETRTGNTAFPDATWSAWQPGANHVVGSPASQYLQMRVNLSRKHGAPTPSFTAFELFYRPRNRAPVVTLRVPAAGETLSGTRPVRWNADDADDDLLTYELFYAPVGKDTWTRIGVTQDDDDDPAEDTARALPTQPVLTRSAGAVGVGIEKERLRSRAGAQAVTAAHTGRARSVRTLPGRPRAVQTPMQTPATATALDKMLSKVLGQGDGSDDKSKVADDLLDDGVELTWNTHHVPDGLYRLKVVASDARTCPDESRSTESISEIIRVDNTAPILQLARAKRLGMAPPLEIPVIDKGCYVASAEYRIDEGEWRPAAAADGIFDSAEETIRLEPAALRIGKHILLIRVRDAAGNEGITRIYYVLGK